MITTNEQHGAIELHPELNKKLEGLYEQLQIKDPEPITYESKRMIEDHIKVVKDGRKPEIYEGKYSEAWLDMQAEDQFNIGAGKHRFYISVVTYDGSDDGAKFFPKLYGPWYFDEDHDVLVLSLFAHYQETLRLDRIIVSHVLDVILGRCPYVSWNYNELDEYKSHAK